MSFHNKGRRGGGGGRYRGGDGGGYRGGGGRNFSRNDHGPPETVMAFCHFTHKCQHDLVCRVDIEDVPFFNAPVYLENKECIGKIDEIFGRVTEYCVTVRPSENISPDNFNVGDRLYIDSRKILPIVKFIQEGSKPGGRGVRGGRGGGCGGGGRGAGSRLPRGRGGLGRRGGGFGVRGGGGYSGRGGGGGAGRYSSRGGRNFRS